jgi:hypothetical protein
MQSRLELAILGGDLRLALELLELRAELAADVVDPRQVVLGVVTGAARFPCAARDTSKRRRLPRGRRAAPPGFASMIREIIPCSMIAYAAGPRPVPMNRSVMSRRRTGWLLM